MPGISITAVTFSPPLGYLKWDKSFRQLRAADGTPGGVLGFDADSNLAVLPSGGGGATAPDTIPLGATEDIAAFKAVTMTGKNANSATVGHFGKVIGIAAAAIANGFVGDVVTFGRITNPAWAWTVGDSVFLNGTTISTSPPAGGFSQVIGVAKAADTIFVSLSDPVLL